MPINVLVDANFKQLSSSTYTIKLTRFSTVTLTRSTRLIYVVAPTLHTMETDTLVYLESLIKRIQVHTQLTIIYTGFVGEKWPPDLRLNSGYS